MLPRRLIRVLPFSSEAADLQLAAGPAMLAGLEASPTPAIRWYQFHPATLLLGVSQRPHDVDQAACAAAGVPIHRRQSGGGIVLGDQALLLCDLALPHTDPLATPDLTESYRWLGELWVGLLRAWGVAADLVSISAARADTQGLDPLLRRVCFAGRSPYEVVVGAKKVVGLAQIRRRAGALFQSGIYLRWYPEQTAALIAADPVERAWLTTQLAERITGLDQLVGNDQMIISRMMQAIEGSLEQFAFAPVQDQWSDHELLARLEARSRYAPYREEA